MMNTHEPVLLEEAITALRICPAGRYVDATFGRGGHTQAILNQLNASGRLMVIDRDPEAIEFAQALAEQDPRLLVFQGAFNQLEDFCKQTDWLGQVDGILMDLGVSSPQLDNPERGFSFLKPGPLDLRFDPTTEPSARTWLATATQAELEKVFKTYGEERFYKRIAKAICETRVSQPIQTTLDLARLIEKTVPKIEKHKHPATRCFQAIRIWINQELTILEETLDQILTVLVQHGRLVVISFHSLEDRIVKRFIQKHSQAPSLPNKLPIFKSQLSAPPLLKIGNAIRAQATEITRNVRARSALMRVAEKRAA